MTVDQSVVQQIGRARPNEMPVFQSDANKQGIFLGSVSLNATFYFGLVRLIFIWQPENSGLSFDASASGQHQVLQANVFDVNRSIKEWRFEVELAG